MRMKVNLSAIASVTLLLALTAKGVFAESVPRSTWPEYQFNPANAATFSEPKLDVEWSASIGAHTNGGLALVDDKIFSTSFDHAAYAFDLRTGKRLWRRALPNVVMSTPIVVNGVVIVGTGTGTIDFHENDQLMIAGRFGGDAVYGLNERDGSIRWKFATAGEDMPSGVIVRNRSHANVFVFSNGDQHVYGVDPENGRVLWRRYVPGANFMTSMTARNNIAYGTTGYSWDYFYRGWIVNDQSFMSNVDHTWAIDGDGDFLWQSLTGQPTNSFAISGGLILAESIVEDPKLNRLDSSIYDMLASQCDQVQGVDVTTGELRWQYTGGCGPQTHDGSNIETAGGLTVDGVLYQALPLSLQFAAFDEKNGRLLWIVPTGGPVKMPAVTLDGRLYFGDTGGTLHVVDAKTGRSIKEVKFKGRFGASPPVIVGRTLFFSVGSELKALPLQRLDD